MNDTFKFNLIFADRLKLAVFNRFANYPADTLNLNSPKGNGINFYENIINL